jgi:osmotically-inducible protein OsmY
MACPPQIGTIRAGSDQGKGEPDLERESSGGQALESQSIVDAARQRLRKQSHLSVQRIYCDFDAGLLFLRGQVPSFYHKQLAQVAVAGMPGVTQVINEIEVVW